MFSTKLWWRWFGVCLALHLLAAWVNSDHRIEQTIFSHQFVPYANHLTGRGVRQVLTYPLWGYPILIALLSHDVVLVVSQSILAAVATTAIILRLGALAPSLRPVSAALVLVGIPWYALHSVKWAMSPSSSLLVLGILTLERAVERTDHRWALVAGLAFGFAMNFTPTTLLLPGLFAVVVSWVSGLTRVRHAWSPGPAVVTAIVAYACLTPWMIQYYRATGVISPTSSNGGMVAYITLGQLPGNPWQVEHFDDEAFRYVREHGLDTPPYSHRGHVLLTAAFVDGVRRYPVAYARKVLHNVRRSLMGGFYNGEPVTDQDREQALDVLKEKLKMTLGLGANEREIQEYRRLGLWDRSSIDPMIGAAFLYLVAAGAFGTLMLVCALLGYALSVREVLATPLLLLCGLAIAHRFLLVGLLQYQPRHMNGIYLLLIPGVLLLLPRLARVRFPGVHQRRIEDQERP